MLNWFRRRPPTPSTGPDFHHVKSPRIAEQLCARGELHKVPLVPVAFGGDEAPPNLIYLTPIAAELKERLDQATILPLAREGRFSRYEVHPEYAGRSVVPTRLRIVVSVPGFLVQSVEVWSATVCAAPPAAAEVGFWAPSVAEVQSLGPEALERAFLADYERWNDFAHAAAERDRAGLASAEDTMAAAEQGYAALLAAYAPPGFQGEPIAFRSSATHTPDRETIVGVEAQDEVCAVRTQSRRVVADYIEESAFVYHLRRADERWYLTSVQLVDETGTYEGL